MASRATASEQVRVNTTTTYLQFFSTVSSSPVHHSGEMPLLRSYPTPTVQDSPAMARPPCLWEGVRKSKGAASQLGAVCQ